jgi:hypothetical protein
MARRRLGSHLATLVIGPEGDKRHQGVGEKEPKDEPKDMGVVVDPRQEAEGEEHGSDGA